MENNLIKHKGIIKSIANDKIIVSIVSMSACATCHSKSFCSISDSKDKEIEIFNFQNNSWHIGQNVNVVLKKSLGIKAVLFGYLFPFLVMISVLFATSLLSKNEAVIGIFSIGATILYYFALYFFKNKFNKKFTFYIERII